MDPLGTIPRIHVLDLDGWTDHRRELLDEDRVFPMGAAAPLRADLRREE
jgi:hypothetical protein